MCNDVLIEYLHVSMRWNLVLIRFITEADTIIDSLKKAKKKLEKSKKAYMTVAEAKEYLNTAFKKDNIIYHIKYGYGVIRENNGSIITVAFPEEGEKKLGVIVSATKGIITSTIDGYTEMMEKYKEPLLHQELLKFAVIDAERNVKYHLERYEILKQEYPNRFDSESEKIVEDIRKYLEKVDNE